MGANSRVDVKVIITGCHGLLGQKLVAQAPAGIEVIGFDLQPESPILSADHYFRQDISRRRETVKLIREIQPDWIINAAAYTDVDGAETEKELCWRVNVTAVDNLAYAARKSHARLVHISSDYVFDGKEGPYDEEATPNPLGYYGRSKLASENVLHASPIEYTIIRTMILYGKEMNGRPNFVTWLIDKLQRNERVSIVTDQFGNTTLANELADGIWKVIEKGYLGMLHIAGREIVDRFTFAKKIARVFDLDPDLMTPVTTESLNQAAPRPLKSGLIIDRARKELGIEMSDVEGGLLKLKSEWNDNGVKTQS